MVDHVNGNLTRLLLVQTQAEAAGAQEISRLLSEELSKPLSSGAAKFETHNLFLYRKTDGCDHFPNVHFAAMERPSNIVEWVKLIFNLFKIIRAIKPDVMLTFQHYGNIVAAPVGRILRVPKIIANHVSSKATISRPVAFVDKLLGLAGAYDKITVNSKQTWQDYQMHPERYRRQLTYVPHGFASRATTLTKQASRKRFNLPANETILGCVSRLNTTKRLGLAIRLLPLMPDVHLALVGQGPDEENLRNTANELEVTDRVHFIGEIPSTDIGEFLVGLDVFVFPSIAETFGLAPVEAAQAGIPVVCSDIPIMREVLEVDGRPCALFVDVKIADAFASSVQQILSDSNLYEQLSSQGRQLKTEHSINGMIDGYKALIRCSPSSQVESTITPS